MKVERERPQILRLTLHAYELSALIAAARWTAEHDELPAESVEQLRRVLASYDEAARCMDAAVSSAGGAEPCASAPAVSEEAE